MRKLSRRGVLQGAVGSAAACLLDCGAEVARRPPVDAGKALDDPGVASGFVTFRGGAEVIDGYLSRPKTRGRYPVVLVVTGNTIGEEYIRDTTARLARAGFVGFAPNIFFLQKDGMTGD